MEEEKASSKPILKINFDKPTNFQLQAAYTAYSKAWDDISSETAKTKLNEIMTTLFQGKNTYSSFYFELNQFRKDYPKYERKRITGQRKRDWRRSLQKKIRGERHRR